MSQRNQTRMAKPFNGFVVCLLAPHESIEMIVKPIFASLMRREQVQAQTGLCRSTLYALIKKGDFPKPVKITGARAVAWPSLAVNAWVQSRIAGVKNA